jgi:hypothetical protein
MFLKDIKINLETKQHKQFYDQLLQCIFRQFLAISARGKRFFVSKMSRLAVGATKSSTEWVVGAFSLGVK